MELLEVIFIVALAVAITQAASLGRELVKDRQRRKHIEEVGQELEGMLDDIDIDEIEELATITIDDKMIAILTANIEEAKELKERRDEAIASGEIGVVEKLEQQHTELSRDYWNKLRKIAEVEVPDGYIFIGGQKVKTPLTSLVGSDDLEKSLTYIKEAKGEEEVIAFKFAPLND